MRGDWAFEVGTFRTIVVEFYMGRGVLSERV